MKALRLGALALLVTACAHARPYDPVVPVTAAPPPDVGAISPEGASIVLRKSAVATQWFWLRAKTLEGSAPAGFDEAFASMADLKNTIGPDTIVWEDLEVAVLGVSNARDLPSAFGALPTLEDDPARSVQLRLSALRVARALAATESLYRSGEYVEHQRAVIRGAELLATQLLPRADAVLASMRKDLGASWPPVPVVLTLVYDAPFRGTQAPIDGRRELGRFVRVRGQDGRRLVEDTLTEIILGFDEESHPDDASALPKLRAALVRRGLAKDDPEIELATHALAAAEARALAGSSMPGAGASAPPSCALFPAACRIDELWTQRAKDGALDAIVERLAQLVVSD